VAFLAYVHLALFLALSLSPGNSWCDHKYVVLQFDKFVSGDVDLCNCTLLRRFHECVDVSDWYYAVQPLTDALNIHDSVCTL